MKRIINLRPFMFIAAGLITGIYSYYLYLIGKFIWLYLLSALIIFYLFFAILQKIHPAKYLLIVISVIVGIALSYTAFKNTTTDIIEKYNYTAKIESVSISSYSSSIMLTECVNTDTNQKLNKNIVAKVYGKTNFVEGTTISFYSSLDSVKILSDDNINIKYYKENIGYKTTIESDKVTYNNTNVDFLHRLTAKIRQLLTDNLDEDISGIAYASIVGDRSLVDESDTELFSRAGIAHLLAISGLHISVICLAIKILLNHFGIRKFPQVMIVTIILFMYLFVCGFCISAVRASLMAIFLCGSQSYFLRYDIMSSLSLSVIIILVISPLSIFDTSFCLSVLSIMGIALIFPIFKRIMVLTGKRSNMLTDGLFVSLSVTISSLPVSINTFGTINFTSAIVNIIVIPVFTLFYVVLFFGTLLSLLLPTFTFLIKFSGLIFRIILVTSQLSKDIPLSFKVHKINTFAAIMYVLLYFVISDFVMIGLKIKSAICFLMITLITISQVLTSNMVFAKSGENFYILGDVTNSAVIIDKEVTLINTGYSKEVGYLKNFLTKKNILKIDNIILSNVSDSDLSNILNLQEDFVIKNIYVNSNGDIYDYFMDSVSGNIIKYSDNTLIKSYISFTRFSTKNGSALIFNYFGKDFCFINTGNNANFFEELYDYKNNFDIVKIYGYTNNYKNSNIISDSVFAERQYTIIEDENIIILSKYYYIKLNLKNDVIIYCYN